MPDWTPAEVHILTLHVERGDNAEQTSQALREAGFDRSHQAVRRYLQRHPEIHARVAPSPVRCIDRPPVLKGDALLLFDVHAPCHDAAWVNRLVDLALKWGIRKVGIGGDLVDFNAFSVFQRSEDFDVEDEIASAEQIVRTLEMAFDEVVYSAGNHESRIARKTDWMLPVETAVRLFLRSGKTTFTRSYWFSLESGGKEWYVEHPRNVSVNPTVIPARLAAKYHKNVVAGHGHLAGLARDVSGRYWAVDSGMCASPERLDYYMMQHNTRPAMVQGAVIIRDGVPVLLTPDNVGLYESMRLAA